MSITQDIDRYLGLVERRRELWALACSKAPETYMTNEQIKEFVLAALSQEEYSSFTTEIREQEQGMDITLRNHTANTDEDWTVHMLLSTARLQEMTEAELAKAMKTFTSSIKFISSSSSIPIDLD